MDNPNRISCRHGQIMLEVLALLMITSFLSIAGFHLAGRILEEMMDQIESEKDFLHHQQLVSDLQAAFVGRYINPFSEEPWLILDTDPGKNWYRLISLKIAVIDDSNPRLWEWKIPQDEPIYINQVKSIYHSDQRPIQIQIRFPDSVLPHFREGVAIQGFW